MATYDRLRQQILFELQRLLGDQDLTQEVLAQQMGFDSGSGLSKVMRLRGDLSPARAKALDGAGYETSLGISFRRLQAFMADSRPKSGRRRVSVGSFDVFLAVPMASSADAEDYARIRRGAEEIRAALKVHCNFEVYCGMFDVVNREAFDTAAFALEDNMNALKNSRYFLLWVGREIIGPSSVWVEAGAALALGKPSVYLVSQPRFLPYILRSPTTSLPAPYGTIATHWLDEASPSALITRHKAALFNTA